MATPAGIEPGAGSKLTENPGGEVDSKGEGASGSTEPNSANSPPVIDVIDQGKETGDRTGDPIETALAEALTKATAAANWTLVEVLARELEAWRKSRTGVVDLEAGAGEAGSWLGRWANRSPASQPTRNLGRPRAEGKDEAKWNALTSKDPHALRRW